ncbi:unnamed protein product, partial [Polarella glacialis]
APLGVLRRSTSCRWRRRLTRLKQDPPTPALLLRPKLSRMKDSLWLAAARRLSSPPLSRRSWL